MRIGIEVVLLCLLALFAPAASAAEAAPAAANEEPRVLVVALDGVPYRLLRQARENGAFEGWPEARPLVSTFPSMTNVAFTAMLTPLGAEPVRGYEIRHYDPDKTTRSGTTIRTRTGSTVAGSPPRRRPLPGRACST